jgi:hypothetical protein
MAHAQPDETRGAPGRAFVLLGRALGWGVLGAVCGLLLGFTIGVIHTPPDVPGVVNEWYTVGVLFVMFVECIAGFVVGAGVAAFGRSSSGRRKMFGLSLGGAALGAGLGWVLARVFHVLLVDWRDGSELVSNLVTQAAGAAGGMWLVASRQLSVALDPPEPK